MKGASKGYVLRKEPFESIRRLIQTPVDFDIKKHTAPLTDSAEPSNNNDVIMQAARNIEIAAINAVRENDNQIENIVNKYAEAAVIGGRENIKEGIEPAYCTERICDNNVPVAKLQPDWDVTNIQKGAKCDACYQVDEADLFNAARVSKQYQAKLKTLARSSSGAGLRSPLPPNIRSKFK